MIIEQIYTGCLSQGAYYIESNGEVAIIDPLREVQDYIKRAEKHHARIKYIFETHLHADFVSGHLTLAEKTGGKIVFGPNAQTSFGTHVAKDGEVFPLGAITITAIHTPGHTMESTTYLLKDEQGKDTAIFTGDTLFLGDVGRPDLAQKNKMRQEDLASILFDSLRNKIMPLADDLLVYPAHGAGSACGKNLSSKTVGTLGDQKRHNYALKKDMTREEFIKEVTSGLLPPPAYFPQNVLLNKEGYRSIDEVIKSGARALSLEEFKREVKSTNALILDVRHQFEFIKGFIPQSIFIGLQGTFAPWAGALIKDIYRPIVLVVPEGKQEEAVTRLSRVGFDNVLGYLQGGYATWAKSGLEFETLPSVSAEELEGKIRTDALVFDVRKPKEYADEHIENATSTPLDFLSDSLKKFPSNDDFYLYCAGGYRSVIAASILKARGFRQVIDVAGGFKAIKNTKIKTSQSVSNN